MMTGDEIDNAIVSLLSSDPALSLLAPGGVYAGRLPRRDERPSGLTVLVLALRSDQRHTFGAPAWEACEYLVVTIFYEDGATMTDAQQISARIHALLSGSLSVPGLPLLKVQRKQRISSLFDELMDEDRLLYLSAAWGGLYTIWADEG
jgi:hypothetical protein